MADTENEPGFDIAIVGAGMAGVSLAWQLLHDSQGRSAPPPRVCLLEREDQPGYHSTGRSAALFLASYGPPQVRALTRASRAFYDQPPAGFLADGEPLLRPRGALYVAQADQAEALHALQAELAPLCPGLQRLDAAAALALLPVLRPQSLLGALFDPSAADIDVHALLQGFLRGFRAAGGMWRCGAELVAAQRDGQAWRLRLADGRRLACTHLVNAAGAWADGVGALAGAAPIGLQPRRRSAFTFAAPEGMAVAHWPAAVGVGESWYFKPDAGQLLGSPANADPVAAHDVQPEALDIAMGIHQIEAISTLRIRRPTSTWAGLRSFVADGELVVGWDGVAPGLFWLAGQGGYGIQSAAGAAQLAAALLQGQPLPAPLQAQGVVLAALTPQRLRLKAETR